ncbi:MAG: SURF1 family protein [Pseudomonadota bacterium]
MSGQGRGVIARIIASPVRLVAVLTATAILLSLGNWQLHRLDWKRDLIAKSEARVASAPLPFGEVFTAWRDGADQDYQPVALKGVYRHDAEAHVFGTYDGRPGYYVFTPLVLSRAQDDASRVVPGVVYVNRGFAPQTFKDAGAREEGLVSGVVSVAGLFRAPETTGGLAGALRPANDLNANVWHIRDPAMFAADAGLEAAPVYIDSFGTENNAAWPKGGVTRLSFSNRHFEYALTWFGLAGALWAVFLAYAFTRR